MVKVETVDVVILEQTFNGKDNIRTINIKETLPYNVFVNQITNNVNKNISNIAVSHLCLREYIAREKHFAELN
jgi:hypothetical protein